MAKGTGVALAGQRPNLTLSDTYSEVNISASSAETEDRIFSFKGGLLTFSSAVETPKHNCTWRVLEENEGPGRLLWLNPGEPLASPETETPPVKPRLFWEHSLRSPGSLRSFSRSFSLCYTFMLTSKQHSPVGTKLMKMLFASLEKHVSPGR